MYIVLLLDTKMYPFPVTRPTLCVTHIIMTFTVNIDLH